MIENEKIIEENQPQEYSPFTVYTCEGEILRSGTAPDGQVGIQARAGEMVIREASNPGSQYVSAGRVWDMPSRPSNAHIFDYVKKEWSDPRTLLELRAARWEEIKLARAAAEFGGFEWDGSRFDSDSISQGRIQGAVQLAAMSPDFSVDWTLSDNSVRTLSSQDVASLGTALGLHVAAQHTIARVLRACIESAISLEEIATTHWP